MLRVLIAEDNPANRELLREILEAHGCDVEEVEDGESALRKIRQRPADIVLMDVQMPQLDGVTTLQRLRSDPTLAAIPVIALTAYAMRGDRERFLAAGFDEYMSKPIEAVLLWTMLERLLRSRKNKNDRAATSE